MNYTDDVLTGHEDARLHDAHRALLRHLAVVADALTNVLQLTDAVRAVDVMRAHHLVYPTADDRELAALQPLLSRVRDAVQAAAVAHDARVTAKANARQERRISIKMEELAMAFWEHNESEQEQQEHDVETTVLEDDGIPAMEDDESEQDDESNVVTPSPPPSNSSSRTSDASDDPLTEQAIACQRRVESLTDEADLREVFESIVELAVDANHTHTFPRSGKPRGPLPPGFVIALRAILERAMAFLLHGDGVQRSARLVLRLYEMTLAIRHPELQELVASPQTILRGLIHSFPETLAGLERSPRAKTTACDVPAQDCFALTIDLLTTTDEDARDQLIDDALHALKQGFRPAILSCHEKVTWAGRVMLLAARIVAHVIAKYAVLKADAFLRTMRQISQRHAVFPILLEPVSILVRKAPFTERPTAPLDLHDEARRIQQRCNELTARSGTEQNTCSTLTPHS